jgi:hypothetical protein
LTVDCSDAQPLDGGQPIAGANVMSSDETTPHVGSSGEPKVVVSHNAAHVSFWLRELPFTLVLILTIVGVAYTSFSKQPIVGYWEILAPLIGLVCIGGGWPGASDKAARLRLIVSQVLHWGAFLVVMNMMLLPSVQITFNASATGLAVFTLLTLGTFTAGVQVLSWQVCLLGLIMALGIPAIAWIENSALIFVLLAAGVLGIVVVFWWYWRQRRAPASM